MDADVMTMEIRRPCTGKTGRWRGNRASGEAWLSEGVEDEVAELLGVERG